MGDVNRWLDGLGLGHYAQIFADNDIGADLLPSLTEADLEKIGVTSLGHRKRLLAAISELSAPTATQAPRQTPEPPGQRRPVTVMFADLTGFTSLGQTLDAEDLHDLLGQFFAAVDSEIQNYGGTIDKHIGDCSMGLFGAPVAHGDDPQRAVRAALAVLDAVHDLAKERKQKIGVHIGVASGEVVASQTGSDIHSAYTVTGDSVNIAARLTDCAANGEILLTQSVYNDVASLVEAELAGTFSLSGIARPVDGWRLLGLRRVTAARPGAFVGRRAELNQFDAFLASCRDLGTGITVLVRGEPGIGKTRLVEEFCSRAKNVGFAIHTAHILDFGAHHEKDILRAIVRSLCDLVYIEDEEARRIAVDFVRREQQISESEELFLNDLLDLPQPPALHSLIDAMDEKTRTDGRIETAISLIEQASLPEGLLLVVEDIHWANRSALDAVARIAAATTEYPILLVITTRLEGDPLGAAWRSQIADAAVVTLDLGRLNETDARALASTVGGTGDAIDRCLARAEGNPLFLEQLLRNIDESVTVPDSIQSVILARIDRLAEADRTVLQAAAVLGQRFDADTVRHITGDAGYDFGALVERYLVRPERDGHYLFAHALVRDGVYSSLLRPRLRDLHRRAADWFEDHDATSFAEHLALAGDGRAPGAFLSAAAEQRQAYRNEVALSLISQGRKLASQDSDRYALACAQGEVLLDLGRAAEAQPCFAAASDFAATPDQTARALYGQAASYRLTDQIDEAMSILEQAEIHAQAASDANLIAQIHHLRGNLYFPGGRLQECLAEHNKAYDKARETGSPELEALALGGLADAEYANGLYESALDHFRHCVALARENALGRIEVANGAMIAATHCYVGPLTGAYEEALANIEAAQMVGHGRAEIVSQHSACFAKLYAGDFEAALAHVRRAHQVTEVIHAMRFVPENAIFEAELARRMGQAGRAEALAEQAWSLCDETTLTYLGPTVLGMLAEAVTDASRRRWALAEGERLLAGPTVAHNHLFFRSAAIDVSLASGEWGETERHAAALDAAFAKSTPFIRFLVARGHLLARVGRGESVGTAEVSQLAGEGRNLGYTLYVTALDNASVDGST